RGPQGDELRIGEDVQLVAAGLREADTLRGIVEPMPAPDSMLHDGRDEPVLVRYGLRGRGSLRALRGGGGAALHPRLNVGAVDHVHAHVARDVCEAGATQYGTVFIAGS